MMEEKKKDNGCTVPGCTMYHKGDPNDDHKDFDFQIGTEEEKFWSDAKEKARREIEANRRMIEINETILKYAEKRIKEEQDLNKSEK